MKTLFQGVWTMVAAMMVAAFAFVSCETKEEYDKLSPEVQQKYVDAETAYQHDKEANRLFLLMLSSILTITSLSIFFAMLVWEFILPLFLKNGQTLGKKIFGIAVIRTNGVKITHVQLFIRTILGKYTFEVMVPVLAAILLYFTNFQLFAIVMVLILLAVEIICLLSTRRTRSTLHDVMSDTVAVDLESQLIFDSEEELMKYKEEQHAKMVNRSPY